MDTQTGFSLKPLRRTLWSKLPECKCCNGKRSDPDLNYVFCGGLFFFFWFGNL